MVKFTQVIQLLIFFATLSFVSLALPKIALAKLNLSIPTVKYSSGQDILVTYSGAEAGKCFAWRLANNDTEAWVLPGIVGCDDSERNYSSKVLTSSVGTFTFSSIPKGNYSIYMFKSGGKDCLAEVDSNCDQLFNISVVDTPIDPTPLTNCSNRPSQCPQASYPDCFISDTSCSAPQDGTTVLPDSVCEFSNAAGQTFCTYKAGVTLPPSLQEPSPSVDPTEAPPLPPCASRRMEGGEFIGCASVQTGLGRAIGVSPERLIRDIFAVLLSISGGIALLLIIRASYMLMVSRGDPEKVAEAREILTSAIVGLLFIIFSVVILQVIGVDILKIPGFE